MSRSLYLWEKNPRYQMNSRMGEPLSQSVSFGEEKISCTCQELNSISMLWHRLKMWAVQK